MNEQIKPKAPDPTADAPAYLLDSMPQANANLDRSKGMIGGATMPLVDGRSSVTSPYKSHSTGSADDSEDSTRVYLAIGPLATD